MIEKKRAKDIVFACIITALICLAAFGAHMQNEKQRICEMENVVVSNILHSFVDALDVYASNLHILAFEKDNPAYIYKLHEALGRMKAGSDALSRETYADTVPEDLRQSLRELARQLSHFTYRFAGEYPGQSPEIDDSVSEMAKSIHETWRTLDGALNGGPGEPWIRNPANGDEWMVDRGYRLSGSSAEAAALEISKLIEDNEKAIQEMDWE